MGLLKNLFKKAEKEIKKAIPEEIRDIIPKELRHHIEHEIKKSIPNETKRIFEEIDNATLSLEDILHSADDIFRNHQNTSSDFQRRRSRPFNIRSRR